MRREEILMEIFRLQAKDFEKWREEILVLFEEAIAHNFPDNVVDEAFYQKKCEELQHYLIEDKAVVLLAAEEYRLAGWIWCHEIQRFDVRRFHIAYFSVLPAWRKRGIGEELLSSADAYAKKRNMEGIDLLVTASNVDAVNFYKHLGFEEERYLLVKPLTD